MSIELTSPIYEFLSIFGFSAVVSGSISAFVNHKMSMSSSRKENIVNLLESKLKLYSSIIFSFDRMRFRGEAFRKKNNEPLDSEEYVYSANESIDDILKSVEEKMESNYYLLKQDLFRQYIYIKTLYFDKFAKEGVQQLRQMLVKEYNSIALEYEKLTGKKLDKIN